MRRVCEEIGEAARTHDTGKFFRLLPKLGIQTFGESNVGVEHHTLEEMRAYSVKIGEEPYPVSEETMTRGLPRMEATRRAAKMRCARSWQKMEAWRLRMS